MKEAAASAPWRPRDVLATRTAAALFVVSAVARIVYARWAVLPFHDGATYDSLAHHILVDGAYRADSPDLKAPGYPVLLAAIYFVAGDANHAAAQLVQNAMDLAIAALVVLVAHRLAASRRVAFASLAIALFDPFTASFASMIVSETLATLLTTIAVLLAMAPARRMSLGRYAAFGAVVSCAALVRPALSFLAPAFLVARLALRPPGVKRWLVGSAVAALTFVAVWAPWGARNAAHYGRFVPYYDATSSSRPGYNRWTFTWVVEMLDIYGAFFDKPARPPDHAFVSHAEREEVTRLIAERDAPRPPDGDSAARIDRRFDALARARIGAHPVDYWIEKPALRCAAMWLTRETTILAQANVTMGELRAAVRSRPAALACKLALFAVMPLLPLAMLAGSFLQWRRGARLAALPLAAGVALTLVVQYFVLAAPAYLIAPEPRYVIECFPPLTPAAAEALCALCTSLAAVAARPFRRRAREVPG